MTIYSTLFCRAMILGCFLAGGAHAQGCALVDKYKLASVMSIDPVLIPLLNLEIPSCANIVLGDSYAGFLLNATNQPLNGGIRSELAIDFPFVEGDTVEYRWSVMIPTQDPPGGDSQQWWVIAQWHDQPDPRLGQTWATLKPQSPPVAIYIERRNGIVGIGLQGMQGKKNSWAPVPLGVWLKLNATIRWSTTTTGSILFSVEGHPELDSILSGPNMLNGYKHYFKAGQYRAPSVSKASLIYLKNVRFRQL
ncbi:MAG: signal peptide protein [Proteobacteria bacterium]|nr:signal peptide protein [Pseudomonadota bacterium]